MNARKPPLARLSAAVAAGLVALGLSGCASAPQPPTCTLTPGIADFTELPCRLAHADYDEAMNRSTAQKLLDGDRGEWIDAAKALFGAGLLTIGIVGMVNARRERGAQTENDESPRAAVGSTAGPLLQSLVGARVVCGRDEFTVLDDSAPAMVPARRFGGRAAVTAVDSRDAVGLLFLGFDSSGRLFEAATGSAAWAAARITS